MTATYDEFLHDATLAGKRDRFEVELGEPPQEGDTQAAVLDVIFRDQHFVIVPYTLVDDLTFEVALFDRDGVRVRYEILSIR